MFVLYSVFKVHSFFFEGLYPVRGRMLQKRALIHVIQRYQIDMRAHAFSVLCKQGGLLLDDRSVLENVLIPAVVAEESFREARARARIALEKCGLAALADLRPHELSAGQRQLAMLARAVVNRPALILADEPAAHLDDRNAQTLIDLLGMFAQAGVTVFLASHRIPRPRHVKVRVIELDAAARRE